MWRTPDGDRILTGAEAELYRYGASFMFEMMGTHQQPRWSTGVKVFDKLLHNQKVAMLREVTRALLLEDVPTPELTALNEGTVAAVYEHLREELQTEIDEPGTDDIRRRMLNVLKPEAKAEGIKLPRLSCDNEDKWRWVMEACMDRILHDRDYQDFDDIQDAPPEEADFKRACLRIDEEYFLAIPPDPSEEQVKQYRRELKRLLRRADGKPDPR